MSANDSAGMYRRSIRGLQEVREYIFDYVSIVDPDELKNVQEEITDIEEEWETLAKENQVLTYRKIPFQKTPALFKEDYAEDSRFRVLNSMRSVETTVQIVTRE